MAEKTHKSTIKIELTPEQMEQIRQATGKEVSALEIPVETLEDRIAPAMSGDIIVGAGAGAPGGHVRP